MNRINNDTLSGAVFVIIAAAFGYQALQYEQGTFFQMGAGRFPATVSLILLVLGLAIIFKGVTAGGEPVGGFSPRAFFMVLAAPIVFALTIEGAGLVISATILVLLSCFASKSMTLGRALATTAILVVMAVGIFIWGLHVQVSAFGYWFTGGA